MLIITATIVRIAKRMKSDIQIIHKLSDNPVDCSSTVSSGDDLADMIFVTVIIVGVAEMVTVVLTVAVLVIDCTSHVAVLVCDSTLMLTEMVVDVSVTRGVLACDNISVLVVMVVDVSVMN